MPKSVGSNARAAIRKGEVQTLCTLLEEHPQLTTVTNSRGDNLLSVAVRAGNIDAVHILLRHASYRQPGIASVMLNHRNDKGDTPLTLGIAAGHNNLIAVLLENPDVNVALANNNMETPLHLAASRGNIELVKQLMRHPGNAPGLPNKKGETALHLAVAKKNLALVIPLMDCPAGVVNQANASGTSVLEIALQDRNHEVVAELLKHPDIDVNVKNRKGESLLYRATELGEGELVKLLINDRRTRASERSRNNLDPLQVAIANRNVALVRLLATDPALANALDANDETALERAIDKDDHAMIAALLENDAVNGNRWDEHRRTPLSRAVIRIDWMAGNMHDRYLMPRIKTLAMLVASGKVDPNIQFHGGETLLTRLCKMKPLPEVAQSPAAKFFDQAVRSALVHVLEARSDRLDLNQRNVIGETALEVTVRRRRDSHGLSRLLLADPRTDPNVLATWLIRNPIRAYRYLKSSPNASPSQSVLNGFVEQTLAEWADRRRPDGGRHQNAYLSSLRMGEWLLDRESSARRRPWMPAPSRASCSKDAVHHFTIALERCVNAAGSVQRDLSTFEKRKLKHVAGLLIGHAPADEQFFNLDGVDVSRAEVELWAAGSLPDALVNRQIERGVNRRGRPDVHIPGLTSRGGRILTELRDRVPANDRLSVTQSVEGIKAAMDGLDLAPEKRARIEKGVEFALDPRQDTRVEEGLGTNVSEVLSALWSYIQTFAPPLLDDASQEVAEAPETSSSYAARAMGEIEEAGATSGGEEIEDEEAMLEIEETDEDTKRKKMHGNLIDALLLRLDDIGDELPCNTGCVQRILYAADGVDFSLTGAEPDQEAIEEEIRSLAAQVNERFETLYGASAEDPEVNFHAASTSAGSSLSNAERHLLAKYQDGLSVDIGLVLKVKQDMLEVRVMSELVGRRGWSEQNVRPELDKIKGWMAYV